MEYNPWSQKLFIFAQTFSVFDEFSCLWACTFPCFFPDLFLNGFRIYSCTSEASWVGLQTCLWLDHTRTMTCIEQNLDPALKLMEEKEQCQNKIWLWLMLNFWFKISNLNLVFWVPLQIQPKILWGNFALSGDWRELKGKEIFSTAEELSTRYLLALLISCCGNS